MEALYKVKRSKTGQADRTMRARMKDTASKSSRANLLDSKRRIPLSEVQPSNQMPDGKDVVKEEKPAKSRIERLQEWKKQREAAKAKQREQEKKNPPFRPCGKKGVRPASALDTTAHPSPAAVKSIPASKKSENGSTLSAKITCESKKAIAKKTVKSKVTVPPRSSARLAAKHQSVASTTRDTIPASSQRTTKSHTSARTVTGKKTGVGSAAKPPLATRGQKPASNSKSVSSKAAAPVSKKVPATKTQKTINEGKRSTRSTVASSKSSGGVAKRTTSKNDKSKSNSNKINNKEKVMEMEEDVDQGGEQLSEPPTPTKRSYMPIHPSPLLKRQVAPVRRETVFMQPLVNDPAWIPGASLDTGADSSVFVPNFDEAFETNSFSPFRFTAAQIVQDSSAYTYSPEPQQCQFVFKPVPASKLNYDDFSTTSSTEIDTTSTEINQESNDPPAKKRRRNSKRRSKRLEEVLPMIVDDHDTGSEVASSVINSESGHSTESKGEDTTSGVESTPLHEVDSSDIGSGHKAANRRALKRRRSSRRRSRRSGMITADSLESESGSGSTSEATCSTETHEEEDKNVDMNAVDFDYFRGLHTGVTDKFTQLCQDWEEKTSRLEEEFSNNDGTGINVEDVLGQIRTTVCQAQLLMRKKLKQYLSLVEQAQDPSVEKRANADDLQSFWDMIYFQVEDVQRKFDAIERLEKNDWREKAPTPAKKRAKKRKVTKKADSDSSEASERLQAAREKREAQRNRLKELKMAAKRAREQETEGSEEPVCSSGDAPTEEEPMPIAPSPKKSKVVRTPMSGRERRRSQRLVSRSVYSPVPADHQVNCVSDVPTGCLISFSPLKL